MIENSTIFSTAPFTVSTDLRLPKIVGCAVRTATGHRTENSRCAWRTLQSLQSNRRDGNALRSRVALTKMNP